MDHRPNRLDLVSIGLTFLTLLGSLAFWSRLPSEVAVHFSATGSAGSYVPKVVAVFLMPVIMVVTFVVMREAARFDPPDDDRTFAVTVVGTLVFLGAIQFIVLGWNLGYQISFTGVLAGAIIWFGGLIGYSAWRTGSIINT